MTTTPSALPQTHLWAAVVYYGICSSALLTVNKLALHVIAAPVFLMSIQLWFAVAVVYLLALCRVVQIAPMQWSTAAQFSPVVLSFLGRSFSNAKVLQYSNVETLVTFCSSTPLILCVFDSLVLGRHLHSSRSVACLVCLLLSTTGYAVVDHMLDIRAHSWLGVWCISFTAYEVAAKHICDAVALDNWTRVVYTNAMAGSLLAMSLPFVTGERSLVTNVLWTSHSISILLASCMLGLGVSHSAYVVRSTCSATSSAVIGILCNVITVMINIAIWDRRASLVELALLATGLFAGAFYDQAPLRTPSVSDLAAHEKKNDDLHYAPPHVDPEAEMISVILDYRRADPADGGQAHVIGNFRSVYH
jgi:solute carrier family 35